MEALVEKFNARTRRENRIILTLLTQSWAKLRDEHLWTKGEWARDALGNSLMLATHPNAVRWSVEGAILSLIPESDRLFDCSLAALEYVDAMTPHGSAAAFNDDPETTHEHILQLLTAVELRLREYMGIQAIVV